MSRQARRRFGVRTDTYQHEDGEAAVKQAFELSCSGATVCPAAGGSASSRSLLAQIAVLADRAGAIPWGDSPTDP